MFDGYVRWRPVFFFTLHFSYRRKHGMALHCEWRPLGLSMGLGERYLECGNDNAI
jgi:hypothetical protein